MSTARATPSPQWLDSMYNNRLLVPTYAAHLARWSEDSKSARADLHGHLDLPYGHGHAEMLDVFEPVTRFVSPNAPVLVFIHGGYWRALDKSDHSFLAPVFTEAGACVVIPNYTLCPASSIPDIADQMRQVLAWTRQNIANYGGDPARITVAGHSAGGQLAAWLLTQDGSAVAADMSAALLKNALSISGLFDLEPIRHTPFLSDLQLTPAQVTQVSPALLAAPAQGELYAVVGAAESSEFLRQNALIRQAWGEKTVPVCESLAGLNHFSVLEALVQPAHRLHRLALKLLGLAQG